MADGIELNMNRGIYEIVNLVNHRRYIGSADNFVRRCSEHKRILMLGKHHSSVLQRAWNKYGESAFVFRLLVVCSRQNLVAYEQRFLNSLVPEYNICKTAGSMLGFKFKPESRTKMSLSAKQRKRQPHSFETRQKMSRAGIGKPKSEAHRQKLSQAMIGKLSLHIGKKRSDETRAKMSLSAKLRKREPWSLEVRAKMSASNKGNPKTSGTFRVGHKHSIETRMKLSIAALNRRGGGAQNWRQANIWPME